MNTNKVKTLTRREAINRVGIFSLGSLLSPTWLSGSETYSPTRHPHIFLTSEEKEGLRSIAEIRESIKHGYPRKIWEKIREECEKEQNSEALNAKSIFPGRYLAGAKLNNPDYTICKASGQRILRNALALLLTEEDRYRKVALEQMWALFDEDIWPDWIDQSSLRFGHPAGLRTGQLSLDVALGFDWMYPHLTKGERERIVEGLERRGIRPFLTSMEQDPWWSHDSNNWLSVIIGGLGIAGMALGDSYPLSNRLIGISLPKMRDYLSIYGAGGEFNESVAYSGVTRVPVTYFLAYYYHMSGGKNPLTEPPFPQTGEWTVYSTIPPGVHAAFGDGWVGAIPKVEYMSAIAAASRSQVLQGFVNQHLEAISDPLQLLWYDPSLQGVSPEGYLPRGRAFYDNGAHIFSRTDWNSDKTAMVVYGKVKRDHNHAHNDCGQVCVDVYGERMIVDLGSPSSYPPDFFDEPRWNYYNASVQGHNVFMFGNREPRYPPQTRGVKKQIDFASMSGRITEAKFDDELGGYWQMDLTRVYDGVSNVQRTVVHLFPGFVAILDEAVLEKPEEISLRWHTINEVNPGPEGIFMAESNGVGLAASINVIEGGKPIFLMRRHKYVPPFDLDRSGDPLDQRQEPYVETLLIGAKCRILTLFALLSDTSNPAEWSREGQTWQITTTQGEGRVHLNGKNLRVSNLTNKKEISISLT